MRAAVVVVLHSMVGATGTRVVRECAGDTAAAVLLLPGLERQTKAVPAAAVAAKETSAAAVGTSTGGGSLNDVAQSGVGQRRKGL